MTIAPKQGSGASSGNSLRPRALAVKTDYLTEPDNEVVLARLRELTDLTLIDADAPDRIGQLREHEIYISVPGTPAKWFPRDAIADEAGKLKYICCIHGGVGGVIDERLLERGLIVTNWHDATADSIGGWAFSLLIAVMGDFRAQTDHVENGGWRYLPDHWQKDPPYCHVDRVYGGQIQGLRVSVYGLGYAGRRFAELAVGCGMQVLACDPFVAELPAGVRRAENLDDLFADAHALVITAALTEQTRRTVTRRRLARLPDGAVVVNVARGGIVDQDALFDELINGRLRAGLDVLEPDYLPPDHPVRFLQNCLLTCHGRPPNRLNPPAIEPRAANCLDNLRRYADGQPLKGVITLESFGRMT